MKTKYLLVSTLLLLAVLLAACGSQATPTMPAEIQGPVDTVVASTAVQGVDVEDINNLIASLQAADVTAELGDTVNQPFFTVPGQIIKVNGQDVQVFAYDTAETMEAEAAQIAADASTIGASMPEWVDSPHFYKTGRLLILYVGQDPIVLEQLNRVLGPQFAGR